MHTPNRREVLAVTASGLSIGLAGCSNETDAKDNTSSEPDPDEEDEPAEILSPDPVYVENFTDQDQEFRISITRKNGEDETELIYGLYHAKGQQGVRFPGVGVNGNTYRISVNFEGHDPFTYEWTVTECSTESRHEEGRASSVFIRDGTVSGAQNECDDIVVGNELTYVSPADVAIDA